MDSYETFFDGFLADFISEAIENIGSNWQMSINPEEM